MVNNQQQRTNKKLEKNWGIEKGKETMEKAMIKGALYMKCDDIGNGYGQSWIIKTAAIVENMKLTWERQETRREWHLAKTHRV